VNYICIDQNNTKRKPSLGTIRGQSRNRTRGEGLRSRGEGRPPKNEKKFWGGHAKGWTRGGATQLMGKKIAGRKKTPDTRKNIGWPNAIGGKEEIRKAAGKVTRKKVSKNKGEKQGHWGGNGKTKRKRGSTLPEKRHLARKNIGKREAIQKFRPKRSLGGSVPEAKGGLSKKTTFRHPGVGRRKVEKGQQTCKNVGFLWELANWFKGGADLSPDKKENYARLGERFDPSQGWGAGGWARRDRPPALQGTQIS